jgi:hypothetical protein
MSSINGLESDDKNDGGLNTIVLKLSGSQVEWNIVLS